MKKIGDITPTADKNGEFTDGNVSQYIPPTLLLAAWFNAVQRELCNVVGFDGTGTDGGNDSQVLEAVKRLISSEIKKIKLGNAAPLDIGTTEGTVAAGDDTRITGALQAKNCLQELREAGEASQQLSLSNLGGFPAKGGVVSGNVQVQGTLSVKNAEMAGSGDISGDQWGGWLSAWLNNAFASRDNNINARAPRNTASLATNGWFKDASTGLIIQWGIAAGNLNKSVVNLPIPFPEAGLWALGWVSGTLDMGDDDWSNSASLLNNSQLTVTTDHGWSTAWIATGH
ncbi:hypothetical protein G6S35_003140 [Salmonella enterica]|nr:hypothetical protein [Salmonella enterica]